MITRRYLTFILAIVLLVSVYSVSLAQWEHIGLDSTRAWTVKLHENHLYAGTDNGVYRLDLQQADTNWAAIGLHGKTVRALLIFNADTILAGLTSDTTSIFRTTNKGANWHPFVNGYGDDEPRPVFSFERLGDSDTIFATGIAVIAKSYDAGLSWIPVWGFWGGFAVGMVFIKNDPNFSNIIWAGGEAAIFAPWLLKSTDWGENWDMLDIYSGGDNRCHDIAIYPGCSDTAWVSMEGRVRKTVNGGEYWADVLINNHYLYGIEIDPLRPANLYTIGGQHGHMLTLFQSRDTGNSWTADTNSSYGENWALDIEMISNPDRNVIYLATSLGIFRYTDITGYICGDVTHDGKINIFDISYIIAYLYLGGPPPDPSELADVNNDSEVNIFDVTSLIAYLYLGGPAPDCP